VCCNPYRNALGVLRVRLGSLCRFFNECEHYRATSHTCNRALDKTYCGAYKKRMDITMKVGGNEGNE
jgi:hypothetical protein